MIPLRSESILHTEDISDIDKQRIDVVMCTYNSNKPYFRLVLKSVKHEAPINNFIVIDKHSHDGTLSVVREIFPDATMIRCSCNLAYARYLGIKQVETSWFMFLNDDAILLPGWFHAIKRLLVLPNVGAIEGSHVYILQNSRPLQRKSVLKLKYPINHVNASMVVHRGLFALTRGMLISTLLRKDIVADWKPHPNQGSLEDYSITQHIIGRGYLWAVAQNAITLHVGWVMPKSNYEGIIAELKKGMWDGSNTHFVEIPKDMLALHLVARCIASLLKGQITRLAYPIGYIIGYLSGIRYCELKR
ncbi:glycosyltransferase [Infirmifilum sp. SLHALR2]|nr:MAG: hypothetical protein B7L53_01655 [Thermofilum sp. NZ13]